MTNLRALEQFIDRWRDRPSVLIDAVGNTSFRASIQYQYADVSDHRSSVVQIRHDGIDDGAVCVNKELALFTGFPEVEFSSSLHAYEFSDIDSALRVRGFSNQMGGDFTVTITPE